MTASSLPVPHLADHRRAEVDVRVCFVGDSFVAGTGDPDHRGWVARLAATGSADGRSTTSYNLGVRRDTSSDVLARWHRECATRLPPTSRGAVVVSFGVNDTTLEDGDVRVAPETCLANLAALLRAASAAGWPALVVGPPAVDDEAQNERTAVLDTGLAAVCADHHVPFVSVLAALRTDPAWRREAREGDGAHPGAGGYDVLASLVRPTWRTWLEALFTDDLHAGGAGHPLRDRRPQAVVDVNDGGDSSRSRDLSR